MCMSAKVPAAVRLAKQALEEEKCVVIGLQSTGEARTEEAVNKYVSFFILCTVSMLSKWCRECRVGFYHPKALLLDEL